jgi:hypothetical protein
MVLELKTRKNPGGIERVNVMNVTVAQGRGPSRAAKHNRR